MTGPQLAAELVNLVASGRWTIELAQVILGDHQIRRASLTETVDVLLQAWAVRLRSAFAAADVESRCAAINELLEEGAARAYLTTHDRLRPHLHFAAENDDVVARVKAVTAGGLAIFTVESEGGRLGVCAKVGCEIAFVDTSRNGLRAYCSARCGNSDAVRRHRGQIS
ncbi:CGNR zinc finger domain-containing protein [Arthrobacter glacialis]|nr:CGNR zinc finger domain-containing protein [Arthrobacter glacialis]